MRRARLTSTPSLVDKMSDPVAEVECPICEAKVPQNIINKHIDSGCKLTTDLSVPNPTAPFAPNHNVPGLMHSPPFSPASSPTIPRKEAQYSPHGRQYESNLQRPTSRQKLRETAPLPPKR